MARHTAFPYRSLMNRSRIAAAGLSVLVTSVTLACKDIPLLPHWDADWNVPLPSQAIALFGPFPGLVPPGTSANISFPPQSQTFGGSVGSLLEQNLSNAALVVVLSKALAVSGADTVFVAADAASLTNAAATRIVVPVAFTAADLTVTDTVPVTAAGITMLQNLAQSNGSLWVQLRGRVSYAGPGNLTVTTSDSIHVRLSLLATIAVSR
jgi:hypothetical protein